MEFGCCCPVEQSEAAKAAGFDYIEPRVVSLEPEADEQRFAEILAQYRASALPVRAFNVFMPADLKIVGPAVDWPRVERYVRTAVRRIEQVGVQTVVFGSGGARRFEEGFAKQAAEDQVAEFLHLLGDVAQQHGVTIAVETLNRRETNLLNTLDEGAAMVRRVNHPAIRLLADLYHMEEEQEGLGGIVGHGDLLVHVHVADSQRAAPGLGSYPYVEFQRLLEQVGYGRQSNQRVSVECRWQDFATEAPAAVRFLHSIWHEER